MLFRQLSVALIGGLAIGAAANPIKPQGALDAPVATKREVPATHALHERQMLYWGRTWQKRDKVPARTLLPMRIGLTQRNIDQGSSLLHEISNPKSVKYGKHLSSEEIVEMFAPDQASYDAVKTWLVSAGIPADGISQSANKQWIQFDATVEEVEELLAADYHFYEHGPSGSKSIAVDEYHVPIELRSHIDYITPGVKLRAEPGKLRKMKKRWEAEKLAKRRFEAQHTEVDFFKDAKGDAASPPVLNGTVCDIYVTTTCIQSQYGIANNTLAAPGNELGIFESLDDHYSKEDLDVFFSTLHPYIPNGTYPEERLVDGAVGSTESLGYAESDAGVESDLDFESAIPLIWPQKSVLFQTDDEYYEINETTTGTPYMGFYNTFFDAIDGSYCTYSAYNETGDCTDPECLDPTYPDPNGYQGNLQCGVFEPTNVISISYGGGEADLPAYYLKRQCNEVMKLGLQGVTVIESSGDYGVASFPGDFGYENGCAGDEGTIFYPSADATCPYVLAVGSTVFNHVSSSNGTKYYESSTSSFYSGGGFSNYFPAPSWQTEAVKTYFSEVDLPFSGYESAGTNFSDVGDGVYKIGGRGYPDVSAIGDNYVLYTEGVWARVGGTSLSAPIWGAILTLVNEHRIAANKSTIGFIQPTLYSHPEIFNDVTEGSNPGCNSTGFVAAKGWDPVSGLG
ncbi:putative Tripeptidyl-peptidase sed1 [Xylariales sp. PMI_506]|nr:putative Tripeptidyl-peptidase sed1 [Xylariales sp. PMI_506]